MANTQITITENGTKTLKTAGKYCNKNIEINVNVPNESDGITPTGTKEITTNGIYDVTNYASASVNVPTIEPTQFTNILTHPSTTFVFNQTYSGAARNGMMCVVLDLAALGITTQRKMEFRMRGLWVDIGFNSIMSSSDKATWSARKSMSNPSMDEYGDCLVTISSLNPTTYPYLLLAFRNLSTTATIDNYAGAILTINEPIGNGGYVG